MDYVNIYKIIIIGNTYTGKTSIFKRFTDNIFEKNHICTIGVDFKIKTVKFNDSVYKLQIWDTAGSEKYRSLTNSFYRGSHAAIFVYDITEYDSFKNIEFWIKDVEKHTNEDLLKILVGNKIDLENKRQVSMQTAIDFANSNNMIFIECSAKNDINIDVIFVNILKLIKSPEILKNNDQVIVLNGDNLKGYHICC